MWLSGHNPQRAWVGGTGQKLTNGGGQKTAKCSQSTEKSKDMQRMAEEALEVNACVIAL